MKQRLRNGKIIEKKDSQDVILKVLYGNIAGRLLLKLLTAPVVSKLAGTFLSTKFSCIFIKPFITKNKIDMTQYEPVKYGSYNDFFKNTKPY